MAAIYFLLTGVILYVVSDLILQQIERALGRRLEQRSLVFFTILLVLALVSFQAIQHFMAAPI